MPEPNPTHSDLAWHDEARRLRADDPKLWTIRALAAHFGKSRAATGEVFKASPTLLCGSCGLPVGGHTRGVRDARCADCRRAINAVKRSLVEGMWADAWPECEIKAVMGVAPTTAYIGALRKSGWDLPHRYATRAMRAAA